MAARSEAPETLALPGAAARPRRFAGLATRLVSAAVLGPCCLIVAWRGEHYFVLLVVLLALTATYEYRRLARAKQVEPDAAVGYAAALVLPWAMYLDAGAYADVALTVLFGALVVRALFQTQVRDAMLRMGATALGILYVSWLGSHLVLLRELPLRFAADYGDGFRYVLAALAMVWISDTGAYFVGSLAGRHKLAPRLSPSKSVEGSLAALVFTAGAGSLLARSVLQPELTPVSGAALGLAASAAGQVGDLVASLLKRDAAVKDASRLVPGHGGVLDRFDSMLLAVPVVYYALSLVLL